MPAAKKRPATRPAARRTAIKAAPKSIPDALGVRGAGQALFQALHGLQNHKAAVETAQRVGGLTLEDQFRPDRTFGEELERIQRTSDELVSEAKPAVLAVVETLIERHHAQVDEKDRQEDARLAALNGDESSE